MKKALTIGLAAVLVALLSASAIAQDLYWPTEGFEDALFPSSGNTKTPTQVVASYGTWIFYWTYRTTSSSGTPVGTADIRVAKPSTVTEPTDGDYTYIVTPILPNGIGTLSFYEGRGRTLTIETSSDSGKTWTTFGTVTTTAKAQNPVVINSATANRIKISNQSASDADIDELSITKFATSVKRIDAAPTGFLLKQNYPNPFNPSTTIRYSLARDGRVTVSVYDAIGHKKAVLVDAHQSAGSYEASWNGLAADGSVLPSGMYFYRIETSGFSKTMRMVLMK
ncbi:MAG TPA: T9SS type A sorting domain-containing protein [bacterium]